MRTGDMFLVYGKLLLFWGLCFLWTDPVWAAVAFQALHPKEVTVGEPFLLRLSIPATAKSPQAVWMDKIIPLSGLGRKVELLLPVPLSAEGHLSLSLTAGGIKVYSAALSVRQRTFGEQSLTVDSKFVDPPLTEQARIQRERAKVQAVYAKITPARYLRLPLKRPLPGIVTDGFGTRRIFNSEPRNRHMGVDFRGAEGNEVRGIAAGTVALAANHYYSGNTVIVDHGLGVYSVYMHLSAIKVKEGQRVAPPNVIGLVGSTGRVTGPHLHLGFVVLGYAQNAEVLMEAGADRNH